MQIEEYLCSKEVSELLHDVGYKGQVIAYYDNYPNHIIRPIEQDNDSFTCLEDIEKIPQLLYLAPLYDQVFDWMEKKYSIYIIILPSKMKKGKYYYHRFDLIDSNNDSEPELVDKFDSKREAKEAAIKQAIEIIKNDIQRNNR